VLACSSLFAAERICSCSPYCSSFILRSGARADAHWSCNHPALISVWPGFSFSAASSDFLLFLDNGKIALIPILALKEATANMSLTSIKITIKYNHRPESSIIISAHAYTDEKLKEKKKQQEEEEYL
jgi:hypothetical protein